MRRVAENDRRKVEARCADVNPGYGDGVVERLELVIPERRIRARVAALARQIDADYRGKPLSLVVVLKGAGEFPTPEAAKAAGAVTVNYGLFINACIRFAIVSFAVFLLVRQVNRLWHREEEKAPPSRTELLLEEIRDLLKSR